MVGIVRSLWWILTLRLKSRKHLEAENLALRHQLNVMCRSAPKRVRLRSSDRLLFDGARLRSLWRKSYDNGAASAAYNNKAFASDTQFLFFDERLKNSCNLGRILICPGGGGTTAPFFVLRESDDLNRIIGCWPSICSYHPAITTLSRTDTASIVLRRSVPPQLDGKAANQEVSGDDRY